MREIVRIPHDDDLLGPSRADDDVRIDDVAGSVRRQDETGSRRVRTVQRNEMTPRTPPSFAGR